MKTSEIKFTVSLDENKLPVKIDWNASDANEESSCKSLMISLWDANENNTLRIDLWTKDMPVDEMKIFFHQTLVAMADTYDKATQDDKMSATMRDFCDYFAEKLELK